MSTDDDDERYTLQDYLDSEYPDDDDHDDYDDYDEYGYDYYDEYDCYVPTWRDYTWREHLAGAYISDRNWRRILYAIRVIVYRIKNRVHYAKGRIERNWVLWRTGEDIDLRLPF